MSRHAATNSWQFPPPRAENERRVNVRELAARPERFEHHLMVVAQVGDAQLELVTASEPLFFAHANISDEYALALPTGDSLLDTFPFRTFILRADTTVAGRMNHAAGQLVLHPHGWLHWPGMLRAPYAVPEFPQPRRCGLSLVLCATSPTLPQSRPLTVSAGLEANVKTYGEAVPFHVVDVMREPTSQWLAQVGATRLDLMVAPQRVAAPGYLFVLETNPPPDDGGWFAGDLVHVPDDLELSGVRRALWLSGDRVHAPPPSWTEVPTAPMAPFEEAARGPLPVVVGDLHVSEKDAREAQVRIGDLVRNVPRYWLARMLFRVALHQFAIGYLETYEGFFYDDRDGFRIGLRGGGHVALDRVGIEAAVRDLYRSAAPPGYTEHLT